jgi:signal transduction histidine kinase
VKQTGVALVLGGALALQAAALAVTWGGASWVFGLCVGAMVCGLALIRHRHRGAAVLGAYGVAAVAIVAARLAELPAEPGPAAALSLAVLTGSAVRRLRLRVVAVVLAAGSVVVVAGVLATRPPVSGADPVTTFHLITWCGAVGVGAALRIRAVRREAVAARVRRQERLDLARELHDVAAHHLTGLVLQAQGARLVAGRHPDRLDGALNDIETAGADALTAMRRVVGLLRTGAEVPLAHNDLTRLVDGFEGPPVTLRLPDGERDWPPEVSGTLYRVVRESLTNVARHAPQARSVSVDVTRDRTGVTVEVRDDGPPVRHPGSGGFGLLGMRERVEAVGGTLHAGPADPGWCVRAHLPGREGA